MNPKSRLTTAAEIAAIIATVIAYLAFAYQIGWWPFSGRETPISQTRAVTATLLTAPTATAAPPTVTTAPPRPTIAVIVVPSTVPSATPAPTQTQPPTVTPTLKPTQTSTLVLPSATKTQLPSSTPTRSRSEVMFMEKCDPRTDAPCSWRAKLYEQFFGAANAANANISFRIPTTETDLKGYDIIIANFCFDVEMSPSIVDVLKGYVTKGGSVVVMGDTFCSWSDKKTTAEIASTLTGTWGITFTSEDDTQFQWANVLTSHPLTTGVKKIHSFRHAYLNVDSPSRRIVDMANRPFIALYDGVGTIVAIPSVAFHWGNSIPEPTIAANVASSDNFVFWRNTLVWLAERARIKHK